MADEFRIEYKTGVSYTLKGKKWLKGKPEYTADKKLAAAMKLKPGFVVTKLKPKVVPKAAPEKEASDTKSDGGDSKGAETESKPPVVKKKKRGR